jgi:hypothetical protein
VRLTKTGALLNRQYRCSLEEMQGNKRAKARNGVEPTTARDLDPICLNQDIEVKYVS